MLYQGWNLGKIGLNNKGSMEKLYKNVVLSPALDIVVNMAYLMLKNSKSKISKAASSISTMLRIC